jgi:hypothetical protein
MVNEITGLGDLFIFSLSILSELLFKGVIRFGRFVKKFNHQWKMVEKDQYFQCLTK